MRVFLIHGMGRSRASMALLARRLRAQGHATSTFGYFVTRAPVSVIAERFVEHVQAGRGDGESYAVVGHSLGNIVTRAASPALPRGFSRFVMLAPPNQPPRMARALAGNPIFKMLTRDAGARLLDAAFYAGLPVPDVPMLIIAGTGGPTAKWLPFQGAPSDGVVAVCETRLPGVPTLDVPAIHTFIMNDRDVTAAIARFLATGSAAA